MYKWYIKLTNGNRGDVCKDIKKGVAISIYHVITIGSLVVNKERNGIHGLDLVEVILEAFGFRSWNLISHDGWTSWFTCQSSPRLDRGQAGQPSQWLANQSWLCCQHVYCVRPGRPLTKRGKMLRKKRRRAVQLLLILGEESFNDVPSSWLKRRSL